MGDRKYRHTRLSDYFINRAPSPVKSSIVGTVAVADPKNITPPSPTRSTAPYPDLSPRKRPNSARKAVFAAPTDTQDKASSQPFLDSQPLRGPGVRMHGTQCLPVKPDECLLAMNVPRKVRKLSTELEEPSRDVSHATQPESDGKRSASLPMLATKLHMTPPSSPAVDDLPESLEGIGSPHRQDSLLQQPHQPILQPITDKTKRHSLVRLLEHLPRIKLVHPSQAATPKALRCTRDVIFAQEPLVVQQVRRRGSTGIEPMLLFSWVVVANLGLLIWKAWLLLQRGADMAGLEKISWLLQGQQNRPGSRLKSLSSGEGALCFRNRSIGFKEGALVAARLVLVAFAVFYLLRVLGTLVETIRAIAWPLRILWVFVGGFVRR